MPTAGNPPNVSPSRARTIKRLCQLGAAAASNMSPAEANKDRVMIRLRPQASETGPANSIVTATTTLVSDNDSALSAALT